MSVMIDVWYIDTNEISMFSFNDMINTLPIEMHKNIVKYKNESDRKMSLYGKLLLTRMVLKPNGISWRHVRYNNYGKPYINDNIQFNISHSGGIVAIVTSNCNIGIDLEKYYSIEYNDFINFFHREEKNYISHSQISIYRFFEVWTRKEAFYKAKGTGLMDSMNEFNCLPRYIVYDNVTWYLASDIFLKNYVLSVCSSRYFDKIITHKLNVQDLFF